MCYTRDRRVGPSIHLLDAVLSALLYTHMIAEIGNTAEKFSFLAGHLGSPTKELCLFELLDVEQSLQYQELDWEKVHSRKQLAAKKGWFNTCSCNR